MGSIGSSFEEHARPLLDAYEQGKGDEVTRVREMLRAHLDAAYDALKNADKLRDGGRHRAALEGRYAMVRHLLKTLYPGSVVYLTPDEVEAQKIMERESGR